jgi:hypothetical protein
MELQAMREVVERYVKEPTTYLGALTDAVTEVATGFSALEYALKHLSLAYMFLMQLLTAGELHRDFATQFPCPNSYKVQKHGKRERLDWLATTLKKYPDMFEILNRYGYPIFASGRGCGLLRTHRAECPLF